MYITYVNSIYVLCLRGNHFHEFSYLRYLWKYFLRTLRFTKTVKIFSQIPKFMETMKIYSRILIFMETKKEFTRIPKLWKWWNYFHEFQNLWKLRKCFYGFQWSKWPFVFFKYHNLFQFFSIYNLSSQTLARTFVRLSVCKNTDSYHFSLKKDRVLRQ